MSTSRHINKICIAAVAVTLVVTILFMCGKYIGLSSVSKTVKYESTLFDTSYVHKIDIVMDDWDSFIENCESEEYSSCTVVVDGEKHANTAIRAKGNTSLSSVKSLGSQRYSFKLEFDHYEDSRTLDGLDKLCLNNLIQDNTMMKDYIAYVLMNDFGADSPLCSFAYITVNGEDWGLYLAVESIEDSFLSRVYGSETGELYKPDSMSFGGGRGNGRDFNMDDFDFGGDSDETAAKTDENGESGQNAANQNGAPSGSGGQFPSFPGGGQFPGFSGSDGESGGFPSGGNFPSFPGSGSDQSGFPSDGNIPSFPDQSGESQGETDGTESGDSSEKGSRKGGFGGFGGGMGSDDVKLKYIDDDPDSYSNIFDNAKTEITKADKTRLIDSLEKLSSYTDLEEVLDTDEVLRYFVVHNFVCNGDSYTGMMIHNYYLHESDGKLSMIPWDYNLAFGTFRGGDASGTVNTSIDSPVSNGSADDRPMVGWIFSDESYTEQYHELFSQFIEKWFSDGELEKLIADTAEMIRPYVEKDPTKFCTTEEFDKGVTALSQFVSLRAEAVRNQLEGSDTEVDASSLNLSDMGSMGGGMGKGAGSFDIFSSIKLTAGDGSEISLSDIVEDTSALVSATLSDGTEIDLASSDMKNLMQTDFSKIVSVKDKNGNITNLSEYTVSVNMPGRSGSAPDISGNPDGAQQSDGGFTPPSENTEQNGDFSAPGGMSGSFTPPGGTADKSSFTGGSGEGEDTSSQGRTFPSSGGTPPDMSGGGTNSDMSFLLLTVLSVLILAVGIIIAVKKKH